jgi:hypothetical protein
MSTLKLLKRAYPRAHPQEVSAPWILATVTGIDAKVVAETALYTVPAGETVVVIGVTLRCTAAVAISAHPKAGVGIAAGADDIFAEQNCLGLKATDDEFQFPHAGVRKVGTAGSVIKLGIDRAAVGTSMTLAADLMGYAV